MSYAASIQSITGIPIRATVFGEEAGQIAGKVTFPCRIIADPATHNPMTLRKKNDEAAPWDV